MPKQEKWIAQNLNKLPSVKLAIGVGGAFDFISGRTRRAPKAIQSLGLEWLWRVILYPARWKKTWRSVVAFSWLAAKSAF
jgi:N-acetylglucosaminyldiphosphoundecaprenol N-acetyl-beta-D-mannosaminyltransferase